MEKPLTPKQSEECKKIHNKHWNSDFEKAYRAASIKDDDKADKINDINVKKDFTSG